MFGDVSDSNLGAWQFWMQLLGIAGTIGVVVSLLGMHLVNSEILTRAARKSNSVAQAVAPISATPMAVHAPVGRTEPKMAVTPPQPVPREITSSQTSVFVGQLAGAPKRSFPVLIFDQDPEVEAYANKIRVMLESAGYECGPAVTTNFTSSISPTGVMIVVKNPLRAPAFAGAIQKAFKAIGIEALGAKDENFGDDQAAVVVGRRID